MRRCGPHYTFCLLGHQHWRKSCSLVLLLSLSLNTLSIFCNSNAILSRSPFTLFMLLFSSTWRLPMQLLSGKL
ncbi:hypothetical protein DFJ58DRAFT_824344 [Suillus subalutaceus]|uniref:uncharacterized protein n=1 Tax=Suillus subalutaceus TaxID=48586 RepID=UPI001B880E97|nr:uncharacterized protein DFJ58DRAFT_824344 [Suillus subalutaceus]KAG1830931.1 hypothetical protein DFJ58DRAFT_824344 [Suillus subalutaceus]